MWRHRLWFSWLIVPIVQVPLAVCWSVLLGSRQPSRGTTDETRTSPTSLTLPDPGSMSAAPVLSGPVARSAAPGLGDGVPAIPDHAMVQRIGRGAYGEVWLARTVIGTYHAVKIVRRDNFSSDEPFEREFRGLQRFMPISGSHPGLLRILHVGRHDTAGGFIYYIMEVADDETSGPSIDPTRYVPKNLAREIRKRGRLPTSECVSLALELTGALEFLHQQHLIHRDIKPANIIFVKGAPKFADIGLVTDMAATGQEVSYVGTKGYLAPEGPGTASADIFALGRVLYEASMGLESPRFPELPATLLQRPDAPLLFRLNEIILRSCQEDPAQRYRSAAALRADLFKLAGETS
jgi:serine/threonine protein kinase